MDMQSFINSFTKMPAGDQGLHTMLARGQDWHWPLTTGKGEHRDRIPLMRTVPYTVSVIPRECIGRDSDYPLAEREGVALSMNLSSGGILLVMNEAPDVQQVLRVRMPTPVPGVEIPTLAEVRWSRPLSLGVQSRLYLVGLKFLF